MATNNASTVTNDQLVSELWARDVRFLFAEDFCPNPQMESADLIQLLAGSDEARLRMALIPLFLRHPELSSEVNESDEALDPKALEFLRFYYTAAVILQRKHQEDLVEIFGAQQPLPDLFSTRLSVEINQDDAQSLSALAKRHQIVSGQFVNWLETYEHSAERFIRHAGKFR